ncbi:MlaD family protein [Aquimarina brevivitae]|uniref:Phospholipid/cholesterol/gamma-HCH transport system substrate-binding protein n=1 Tax=Aquimarina brevivitae TaxID=323412 RepID=A0A4V2F4W5_9FLAO|nr:MlaD family protein [Aquimarina brevivitae]RZS90739.1 phospholipid/cholesterol/gamma-HCH transport system substrate-binding protein [Aquimarina brevivitae]
MKFTREVKTGLLAVAAIVLFIFGYSFLKGKNLLEDDRTFYAIYENVEGLIPSSPVTINGLTVGQVISIDFADNKGNLLVTFNVDKEFKFSKNSLAQVYGGGLIGGKSLAIIPVYEEGQEAKDQDTLPGKVEEGLLELVNDRLTPLQEKLEAAITDADTIFKTLGSTNNRKNVNKIFEDLSVAVNDFKGISNKLNRILANNETNLNKTFTNFNEVSGKLNQFGDTLAKVNINKISEDLGEVLKSFKQISTNLESGKGTAGKLLKDEKLYDNLSQTSKELELLLQDMRLNPKRYVHFSVFGKKNKEYQPPKEEDTIN